MNDLFPVYEVGSLPKLNARVQAFRGAPVTDHDIQELSNFAKMADVDASEVNAILDDQRKDQRKLAAEEKAIIMDFNCLLNLKLMEKVGLDYVYDGEARRSEMYRHCAKQVDGFEDYPEMLRSRGPDSWWASICADTPEIKFKEDELPVIQEYSFVQKHATNAIKVPLDDPYMIANMTGNRHYVEELRKQLSEDPKKLRYEAKRELTLALGKNVIRPQVEALVKRGAQWIQLDIPSATIDLEHIPIMVEGINAVAEGFNDVKFSLHICYPKRVSLTNKSGYELLFPHILDLADNVNHLSLELANGDQYEEDLKCFADHLDERAFELGVGVVDITLERQLQGKIETAEEIRDRILLTTDILKDPSLVYVAPDCGARQLTLSRSFRLFELLVEGAAMAREALRVHA